MWSVGEYFVLKQIFDPNTFILAKIFMLVWVTIWTVAGLFVMFFILWQILGFEIIIVTHQGIRIEKTVLGIGSKNNYDIGSIKDLMFNDNPTPEVRKGKYQPGFVKNSGGKIKFSFGTETIQFGNNINREEAEFLFDKIKRSAILKRENFNT
ncbi:MAG: hypothetical protein H6600_08950 [Flavobacteriales bacterium]|nr:hypothetical protein [Flavobacteriales bacterium]